MSGSRPLASANSLRALVHGASLSASQSEQWESLFQQGLKAEQAGNWVEAEGQLAAAARIDDQHADLRFHLGQCALRLGRPTDARAHLLAARDLDVLRFRC